MYEIHPMFERCTDRGRCALRLARRIAGRRTSGPQEMLHALRLEGKGVAANILSSYDLPPREPSEERDAQPLDSVDFEVRLLSAAAQEAAALHHDYVGTEHLLLALLRLYPNVIENPDEIREHAASLLGKGLPRLSQPIQYAMSANPYKSPEAPGGVALDRTDWQRVWKNVGLLAGPALMLLGFVGAHVLTFLQPAYIAPKFVAISTVVCFWAGLVLGILQLASFFRRTSR